MKKVIFKTRRLRREIGCRLSDEAYAKLIGNKHYNPYELYNHDYDAVRWNVDTYIFSKYQIKRLMSFETSYDFIDTIIVDGKAYDYYTYS